MSSAVLNRKIVVDGTGKPVEVIIPYEEFIDFVETYGLDLSDEERLGILEAKADIAEGDLSDFVTADEAKREIGCTE